MPRRLGLVLVAAATLVAFALFTVARSQQPAPGGKPASGNVRDHGAKGDGTTDDWQAVQNAVDAAAGAVHFPPGTYRISRPVVVDLGKVGFTSLRGDVVARIVMAGEGPAFRFVGSHGGTASPPSVKDVVWAKERMPAIDGLEIVGDHPNADGIDAVGTMKLTITRVLIRKCRHGVHLSGRNRNTIISDSHIYENRGIGVFLDQVNLHQINVTGCHISYNERGGIVVMGGEVRNLQVTGCDIESNHGKDQPPTANVLIDSTGGANAEAAIVGNTIQHNHTSPGSANVRIRGPSKPTQGTDEERDGHIVIADNVLSDVMVNIHVDHARGVVISGNTCWTGYEHNFLIEQSSNIVMGPNNLDRNPRYHREEIPTTANDVLFRDCRDCTITGLHITGVRAAPAAVTLERCSRFNLSNLTILDCDNVGLLLQDVTRSRISGCLIRDDRPNAKSLSVRTSGGQDNTITENVWGRPHDILRGVGIVERNHEPWKK